MHRRRRIRETTPAPARQMLIRAGSKRIRGKKSQAEVALERAVGSWREGALYFPCLRIAYIQRLLLFVRLFRNIKCGISFYRSNRENHNESLVR